MAIYSSTSSQCLTMGGPSGHLDACVPLRSEGIEGDPSSRDAGAERETDSDSGSETAAAMSIRCSTVALSRSVPCEKSTARCCFRAGGLIEIGDLRQRLQHSR